MRYPVSHMKWLTILIISLFFVLPGSGFAADSYTYEDLIRKEEIWMRRFETYSGEVQKNKAKHLNAAIKEAFGDNVPMAARSLFRQGGMSYIGKDYNKSALFYTAAFNLGPSSGWPYEKSVLALNILADTLVQEGNPEKAVGLWTLLISSLPSDRSGDLPKLVFGCGIAMAEAAMGRKETAISQREKLLSTRESLVPKEKRVMIQGGLLYLARAFSILGDYEGAETLFKESWNDLTSIGATQTAAGGKALYSFGLYYYQREMWPQAAEWCEKAYSVYQELKDRHMSWKTALAAADCYDKLNQREKAAEFRKKAEALPQVDMSSK
jgi:tetratricopeptide (TPR) repeat protein